jgi:hypothetical protein
MTATTVVDAYNAGSCPAVDLGIPTFSEPGKMAALAFSTTDSNVLYDVNAFQAGAELKAVTVVRDPSTPPLRPRAMHVGESAT